MNNQLTDRQFWVNYWENKTDLVFEVPANYLFFRQLQAIKQDEACQNAIELGGFPGYYAVFLRKHLGLETSLFDYFVHRPLVDSLLQKNGLGSNDIKVIEADLFNYSTPSQYDLVLSCGLIEHFQDTADILRRHIAFMKPGATLFVTLPNFRSFNGWFQKKFDRENYDKHNLACMDPALLRGILEAEGLQVQYAGYFGKFGLWLENEGQRSMILRWFKKICWLKGKILTKIFPFESRVLSPYIILRAKL